MLFDLYAIIFWRPMANDMALTEKAKEFVRVSYPRFTIVQIAEKFACRADEVEEYVLEEAKPERIALYKEAYLKQASVRLDETALSTVDTLLTGLLIICLGALVFGLSVSPMSNNDIWLHLKKRRTDI